MSVSEVDRLVNACLLPGFHGELPPGWVAELLGEGLAGVTVYGHNLTGSDSAAVRRISTAVLEWQPDALVSVDEEGGDVTRLDYLTGSAYPGNLALGAVDDVALTYDVARAIAADLRVVSVNLNLAPSVDVNSDPHNPVIGVRSFGPDPGRVAAHGAAYIRGMQDSGVAASAKHFPGHGATRADSHLDLPLIDCDLETFRRRELPPFAAAVEAGTQTIMTAHVVFSALDDQPATLSRRILTGLLRDELGYDGVVVTDALDMAGVRAAHGIPGAAVRALTAGADLLLVGAEDGERHCADIRRAVAGAVAAGELDVSRVEEAAGRVARLRKWCAAGPSGSTGGAPAAGGEVGLAAARRAVRVTGDPSLFRPAVVAELRSGANLAVGDAHWSLAEPLDALGLLGRAVVVTQDGVRADDVTSSADGAPLVVAVRDAYRHPWQRDWVSALLTVRPDAVLVAVGMPDDAELAGAASVLTYGAGRVNTWAAAERLAGTASPSPRLPRG